jgi:hypothetical protein
VSDTTIAKGRTKGQVEQRQSVSPKLLCDGSLQTWIYDMGLKMLSLEPRLMAAVRFRFDIEHPYDHLPLIWRALFGPTYANARESPRAPV